MLSLLLKMTVAWFSLSLLCVSLWAVLIKSALRERALQTPAPVGTFTQDLSEQEVEALLEARAGIDPAATDGATSQPVRWAR